MGLDRAPQGISPIADGQIVILLPALDEEQAVGAVIDRIPRVALERRGYRVAVWIVDGHSEDLTREIGMRKQVAIFVQAGDGKGNGMAQAFRYLTGATDRSHTSDSEGRSFYFMLDSDGTYSPEDIPHLLDALESGYDLVIGSRFRGHIQDGAITRLNRIGNVVLNAIARLLYGVSVTDVCTGMWGFNEDLVRKLTLAARGFDLEADMFASACKLGARLAEVPIDYAVRTGNPKLIPYEAGLIIAWRLIKGRLFSGRPHPWDDLALPFGMGETS